MTGQRFKGKSKETGAQFSQGFFYEQQNSFGSAVENCRVACRSCEQAESKYLLRTRYTPEEFKMLIKDGKIKKKTISKSYPISQVCTDGKGHNFLKCGKGKK